MKKHCFTPRFLNSLKPANHVITVADNPKQGGELGLKIQVRPSGRKVFIWRRAQGTDRLMHTLGEFPSTTLNSAREAARDLNRQRADGTLGGPDPDLTLKAFYEEHYTPRALTKLSDATQRNYGIAWKRAKPLHGKMLGEISRTDIALLHSKVGQQSEYLANTVRSLVSVVLNRAADWGYIAQVPRLPKRFPEKMRDRYLDSEEVSRLMTILDGWEPLFSLYFKTVLFTGSRKMEVAAMRWDQLDMDRGLWRRIQKGGRIAATVVSEDLVLLLRTWKLTQDKDPRTADSEWVFPAQKAQSGHLEEPCRHWRKICTAAGIMGASIHTLRHTHATWMAMDGASQQAIGKQLGHRQLSTTERYTHYNVSGAREWVNNVTQRMVHAPALAKANESPTALDTAHPERR